MSSHLTCTSGNRPVHFHELKDNYPVSFFMDICHWLYGLYSLPVLNFPFTLKNKNKSQRYLDNNIFQLFLQGLHSVE